MHVVITGTNRGIGARLAARYRAEGADVTATIRDGAHPTDVTRPDDLAALATRIGARPVDLLICNAGVYLDKGHSIGAGYGAQVWADSFAANVTGVFLTVEALLPHLRRAEAGRIAIISSRMGSQQRAPGGSYAYRASKAAALNLGRNMARDFRAEGIAVGIYHPGWVRTDMGGGNAEIDVEEAATGLHTRFAALDLARSGCFETWDGRALPL